MATTTRTKKAEQPALLAPDPEPEQSAAEPEVIEITTARDPTDLAPPAGPVAPAVEPSVGFLVQLGIERGLDPDALKTMMDVYERLKNRDAKAEFDGAMALFQAECPQTPKTRTAKIHSKRTGTTYEYTYAPMEVIAKTIAPHLHRYGLSYTFDSEVLPDGNFLKAVCTIQHDAGHAQTSSFTCPLDTSDKDPRKYGIARTYACRYALIQALGITTADPDPDGTSQAAASVNLSTEQLEEIQDLIDETDANVETFLVAVGAPSMDEIPEGAFQLARAMLRRRLAIVNEAKDKKDETP